MCEALGRRYLIVAAVAINPGQAPTAGRLHAYIDEAGVRAHSRTSSDHFVMTAVVVADEDIPASQKFLAQLRSDLGRGPGDQLHFVALKQHEQRVHAAKTLGCQEWAIISNVVARKRHLNNQLPQGQFYLYTFRYLLERLSWFARDAGGVLSYTLAHISRPSMTLSELRQYEAALRHMPTSIEWAALDPKGGKIDQPKRIEMLQCADLAASAAFHAFEPDRFGNTEPRYLQEMAARLYRRRGGAITSYGLKLHPAQASTKAAYPWVAAL
ncbi:DUF3800 domain-containing protein [Streptomyces sp. SL13]|uniref:DUF3800 domain-containing protein n=1 Tax=Streptantibioticus silvisoli TaxID=2705255 RepID=A0AA90H5V0_9ACTN|nr:DUF3800 domain-containing protein [Streptantibioticus silvisoli]MDI5971528.1 DUF3800 domain-containing protein [Streptantibioticus silvisoli]